MSDDDTRRESGGRPPVINKALGTCPVCGYKIFEYNNYLRTDRRLYHNHCLTGGILKVLLEMSNQLQTLTEAVRHLGEGEDEKGE